MRMKLLFLALGSMLFIQGPVLLDACGDKLLMLGRGIRFQSKHTPRAASILLYLPAGTRALSDPSIESALREAGHKLRSVTTKEEFAAELRSGPYEVVLTDLSQAAEVQRTLPTDAASPFVLPAVYLLAPAGQQPSKSDTAKAAKEFGLVLAVPGRAGHYCATVDKAMELKLKKDRSQKPRS